MTQRPKPSRPPEPWCCRCGQTDARTKRGFACCESCRGEAVTIAARAKGRRETGGVLR